MKIDKTVPFPRNRKMGSTRRNDAVSRAFKQYKRAYAANYGGAPSDFRMLDSGLIAPMMGSQQQPGMSLTRMQQLTRTYEKMALNK